MPYWRPVVLRPAITTRTFLSPMPTAVRAGCCWRAVQRVSTLLGTGSSLNQFCAHCCCALQYCCQ